MPKPTKEDKWRLEPGRTVKGRGFNLSLNERILAARRVPQAVVKVASYAHGKARANHLLRYISREGAIDLETESGEIIAGLKEQKELISDWSRNFGVSEKSRDVVHVVYSSPRGTDPEKLRQIVREVLSKSYPDHQAVFGIHEDTAYPHAHVAINMRSREKGKKLRLNLPELHRMREEFAKVAREHGIEMAVSPRAARGVTERRPKQPVFHMRKRKELSRSDHKMVKEILNERTRDTSLARPWEDAIARRHKAEKLAYQESAEHVLAQAQNAPEADRKRLFEEAELLAQYGKSLPTPKTRRDRWNEKFSEQNRVIHPGSSELEPDLEKD